MSNRFLTSDKNQNREKQRKKRLAEERDKE